MAVRLKVHPNIVIQRHVVQVLDACFRAGHRDAELGGVQRRTTVGVRCLYHAEVQLQPGRRELLVEVDRDEDSDSIAVQHPELAPALGEEKHEAVGVAVERGALVAVGKSPEGHG